MSMILISSVCYAILLVIFSSNRSTSATGYDRIKEWDGFWTEQEKIDLMMSWYKVYRGIGYKDYTKKLLEEYGQTPSGLVKERSRDSLTHKANELLREGFTIPAEESGGEPIKLNVEVKHERDRVSLAHKANSSAHDKEAMLNIPLTPWSKEEEIGLAKVWLNVYKGRKSKDLKDRIFEGWKRITPRAAIRTPISVIAKSRRLIKSGFTIPAENNNGVEVKINESLRAKRDAESCLGGEPQKRRKSRQLYAK